MSLCKLLLEGLEDAGGLEPEEVERLAAHLVDFGAKQGVSATYIYWPSRFRLLTPDEQAEAIRQAWKGNNVKEICAQFGIGKSTVYRALKRPAASAG